MANYTYLVEDLIAATENDGTEFLNYIPKIVGRAEERLTRVLDDYGLVQTTAVTFNINDNSFTLPVGTRTIKNINYNLSGETFQVLQRTDEFIRDYWPVSASTNDIVNYYARVDNTKILLAPTPAQTVSASIVYVAQPTPLTSATQNNYFSDYCYDALFNASMVEALVFMKDYQTSQLFEQRYQQVVESLRNQARRTRRDDMETATSPAGADNPVIPGSN